MRRRERVLLGFSLAALAGVLLIVLALGSLVWRSFLGSEERQAGELAEALAQRTEQILVDARDVLEGLERLAAEPCSREHLEAMQDAAISRPYIRTIGHWRAAKRQCGVGFLAPSGLRPPRADRIYDSGVIAWWPSAQTEVGGVRLFLMRYGDHDIAIDPRMLLEIGPLQGRSAALWVEGMQLAASGEEGSLPEPESVSPGLTIDREAGRILSRHSRTSVFPIDIVAAEPMASLWGRHLPMAIVFLGAGLALILVWVGGLLRYSRRRISLPGQLREAIDEGRIRVHYQPILDLASGICIGAEALARWEIERGEWISPDVFVPVAEQSGLIGRVTLAVLDGVLADLGPLLRERPGFSVNLNLASQDLLGDGFTRELERRIDAAGIDCRRLKLEITERALIDEEASRTALAALRRRGHPLVVDDFGTGYSSLSYLERLALDALKIDKSFVDGIGTGAVTGGVIGHIIEMAASLDMEAVAEGIENQHQLDWLIRRGVRCGQGFHFSRPLPAPAFVDFLTRNSGKVRRLPLAPVLDRVG